jgi:hypothetical protein
MRKEGADSSDTHTPGTRREKRVSRAAGWGWETGPCLARVRGKKRRKTKKEVFFKKMIDFHSKHKGRRGRDQGGRGGQGKTKHEENVEKGGG